MKLYYRKRRLPNLCQYYDLYAQSDTLLTADIFESFRKKCLELYELDPAHFFSASGLVWQACLKKTEVELELLTEADIKVKGIKSRICHVVHRCVKAKNKCMKDYDPNTESSYLMYWDVNNLCRQPMQQKLPVDGFKRYKFTQKFIQSYDDDSNNVYILRLILVIPGVKSQA